MNSFRIINAQHYIEGFNSLNCGKSQLVEVNASHLELKFYEVKPSEGYEMPVNKETGEKMPYCCETHKQILKITQDWFNNDFPNCCEAHKNLLKASWFKKEDYKEVPLKVVNQISYTTDHIARNIEKQDWYKKITDYIEYNLSSFGQLPTGYGNPVGIQIYISQLKYWIECQKDESLKDKFKQLNDFIDSQITPITPPNKEAGNDRDLNILLATYQKWLKVFPFGISYFAKLKQHFSSRMPFLAEMPAKNNYTGLAKAKLQTQAGLVESLNNLTTQLLQQINTDELLKSGVITDKNKHSIELAGANHKLKQSTLLTKYSKGELKYVKVLKAWLANEKQYFKEIRPMIQATSNTISNDEVLVREDYYKILMELYSLHRNTVATYLTKKCEKHLPNNPEFVECLYKDITKVLEGVHKEGDLDLDFSTGDFEEEYGDIKVTGKPTIFDDAQMYLWMKLLEINSEKYGVLKFSEGIKTLEKNVINRDDYTPEYAQKLAELNQKLKKANGIVELSETPEVTINKTQPLTVTSQEIPNTPKEAPTLKLTDIIVSEAAYKSIIEILVNKGHCQKDTLKWIDDAKGNKGLLIAVLKEMRANSYFKNGVNPSNEDYKDIAANTFDLVVSIDTVKKSSPKTIHIDFIPLYSAK